MGFDITQILNAATAGQQEAAEEGFEPIRLDYEQIKITKHNKYSMDEISELAAGIEMAGGLHEPLILGRVNGEYCLASGHRRHAAVDLLVKGGAERFREVDCKFKDMTETEFRLHILIGNAFNRHYTDYDKMIEAAEWKEVLTQARKEKMLILEKGERVRDYVARIMKTSAAVVGDWERINNNAEPEIKEQFQEGTIGVTAAAAASQLPAEEQKEIAERIEGGEDVKAQEIRDMVEAKKEEEKESRAIAEQKADQMSDTDTTEEEKENARKLHVLKMLEKYYIYMNEDDTRTLEAMLEDCKRRKREYGLEDCGSTV